MKKEQRLSKYLAAAGVASRRACEELIFDGAVTVNGELVLVPQTPVSDEDAIAVHGRKVKGASAKAYYLLNKPTGYICSTVAGEQGNTVYSLLPEKKGERLFTVGRLDVATSGLLLLTNDGQFANKIMHPSSEIEKEYAAEVDHQLDARALEVIAAGTEVEGRHVTPCSVERRGAKSVVVVVTDGRRREVRCLIENAGLRVVALKRTRIGGLRLKELPIGRWKPLTEEEKERIFQ